MGSFSPGGGDLVLDLDLDFEDGEDKESLERAFPVSTISRGQMRCPKLFLML